MKGFIAIPLMGYMAIACGLVVMFAIVQTHRLKAVKVEYAGFVALTKANGEAARKEAVLQTAADMRNKERADEESKRVTAGFRADIDRLRNASAGRSIVPASAPGALRTDLACFSRTELESALGGFVTEARGLVDEGSQATLDLNVAKEWAHGR